MGGKSVYGWFQFADMDLALAEHALSMHPQPLEAICYHCQQSSKKYLKGILDECEILTQYGVQPRYPDEIYIDEALMKRAIVCAEKIKSFETLAVARQELEQESDKTDKTD